MVVAAVILTVAAVGLSTLVMGHAVILLNIGLAASLLAWLATARVNLPLGCALVVLLVGWEPHNPRNTNTDNPT